MTTTWNRLPIFHACFSAGFLSRLYQTFGHVSFVCLASHRRHRAAAPTLAVKSRVAGTQQLVLPARGTAEPFAFAKLSKSGSSYQARLLCCSLAATWRLSGPPAVLYAPEDSALSYHGESCCVTTPLMYVPLIRYSYTIL